MNAVRRYQGVFARDQPEELGREALSCGAEVDWTCEATPGLPMRDGAARDMLSAYACRTEP